MTPLDRVASALKDSQGSRRTWLSGLAVTLTTIVAYLAFWRLAPGTTFIVGCIALVCLVIAGWVFSHPSRQREK
jgi:type II secretory pathway component PulM